MKKLIFLFLIMPLLCFDYAHSQDNSLKKVMKEAIKEVIEKAIKTCKEECEILNTPRFCKRICEKEIFDPRWNFLGFNVVGSAYFYDPKSIFISDGVVKVWRKIIYSEKAKQDAIKKLGAKYKKLDQSLILYKIDCSKRRFQILEVIDYALDGSILNITNLPEFLAEWDPIPPGSIVEGFFEKICVIENTTP